VQLPPSMCCEITLYCCLEYVAIATTGVDTYQIDESDIYASTPTLGFSYQKGVALALSIDRDIELP